MNYFLKYRFAIWTAIILSVIILSSLGTVLFLKVVPKHNHPKDAEPGHHAQIAQFFKNELKLSPDQEKTFKENRKRFFENSKVLFDSLEKKRIQMIEEMGKPVPDTVKLYHIADDMGLLHAKLRYETIHNLLRLRAICNPEQVQKLNLIYKDLVAPEGPMRRRGSHSDQHNPPPRP